MVHQAMPRIYLCCLVCLCPLQTRASVSVKNEQSKLLLFFFSGFIALAARRSRVPVLAWQSQHEVHSTKSLCIGFIRLKELIGFPPEPCGGAGSLALRLGV